MNTIHRSERVLPSLVHMTTGNGLRVVFNLAALLLISKATVVHPDVRDTFVVYLSAVGLLELCAGQWMLSTLLRFGTEEYTARRDMAGTLTGLTLTWLAGLVVFVPILWILSGPLTSFIGLPYSPLWVAAAVLYPFLSVNRVLLPGFLQAAGHPAAYAYYPLVQPLVFVVLLLRHMGAPLGSGTLDLPEIVSSLILAEVLSATLLGIRIAPLTGRPRWDGAFLRRMARYSAPFLLAAAAGQVVQNVDILVMADLGLAEGRAMPYKIAYMITGYATMVPNLTILVLFPLFLERRILGRDEGMRRYYGELVPQLLLPLGIALALFGTLGGPILGFFLPRFREGEAAFALLFLSVYFATLIAADSPLFRSHDKVWGVAWISIGMAALNIALDYVLLPRYGMAGAGLATLLSFAAAALCRILLLRAALGFRHLHYFLFALPAVLITLVTLSVEAVPLRIGVGLGVALVVVLAVRKTNLYRPSTLHAFRHAGLPAPLFSVLLSCYKWLGKEGS